MTSRNLGIANRRRMQQGAKRQVLDARRALRTMRKFAGHPITRLPFGHPRYPGDHKLSCQTLTLRLAYPTASLTEIADSIGVTKHVYSGRLRRAFSYAARLEALQEKAS